MTPSKTHEIKEISDMNKKVFTTDTPAEGVTIITTENNPDHKCDSKSISLWTLCSKLCCIFCCPPCLPCITSKLAFHPPTPSYRFEQDVSPDQKLKFVVNAEEETAWDMFGDVRHNMEVFFANSSRGNKIACLYIRYWPDARYTILLSRGNSVDIGLSSHFLRLLCKFLHCNILTYDYSGYGVSSGNPSESSLYADIAAAFVRV